MCLLLFKNLGSSTDYSWFYTRQEYQKKEETTSASNLSTCSVMPCAYKGKQLIMIQNYIMYEYGRFGPTHMQFVLHTYCKVNSIIQPLLHSYQFAIRCWRWLFMNYTFKVIIIYCYLWYIKGITWFIKDSILLSR